MRYACSLEVVDGKQRGGAFAGRGREDGRIGEGESAVVEEVAGGFDDFGADAEDGTPGAGNAARDGGAPSGNRRRVLWE